MNIDILENKLQYINNSNVKSILELLIEAVRDYPLFNLEDIFTYFEEVENLLNNKIISKIELEKYLNDKNYITNEKTIWIISSLSLFYEAFLLMELYKISFKEIKKQIKYLDSQLRGQI